MLISYLRCLQGDNYQIKAPHEVDGRCNENQSLDKILIFKSHFQADPGTHAAPEQDYASFRFFALGNLDGSLAVIEPVAEL